MCHLIFYYQFHCRLIPFNFDSSDREKRCVTVNISKHVLGEWLLILKLSSFKYDKDIRNAIVLESKIVDL